MNTSILTVAFAGVLLAGPSAAPNWHVQYTQARKMGAQQQKPLVVVFGSGDKGMANLVREEAVAADANKLLNDKFVCVYVDVATSAGKSIAQSFEITGNVGIVISDRTGELQAFWHQGHMTNQVLIGTLQKFADSQGIVRTTETGTEAASAPATASTYVPQASYTTGRGRSRRTVSSQPTANSSQSETIQQAYSTQPAGRENGIGSAGSISQTGYATLLNPQSGNQLTTPQVSNCLT